MDLIFFAPAFLICVAVSFWVRRGWQRAGRVLNRIGDVW